MAELEASNGNVFDMSRLMIFNNKERDKSIVFGSYNGTPEITLSDGFKKGVAPKKVKLTMAQLNLLAKTLARLINNPGPNLIAPVKFTKMERQPDNTWSKPIIHFVVQFSTNDKSIISLSVKHIDRDGTQVECISPLYTNGVESDLMTDPAASSLNAAEGLLNFIRNVWCQSSFFTRNNLFNPRKMGQKNTNRDKDLDFSSSTTTGASEDIVF